MNQTMTDIKSVGALLEKIEELRTCEDSQAFLSIYCKTGRLPDDAAKARIRFKNALAEAETKIALHDLHEFSKPLQALSKLPSDEDFWNHQSEGLAVFVRPGSVEILKLNAPVPDEVVLGPEFHLKPVLALAANADVFYLLSLSQKKVTLDRVSHLGIQENVCPHLPQGYEDAMEAAGYDEDSRAMKGLKSERKVEDKYLKKYFEEIERAVAQHLDGETFPLILACADSYGPVYREVNTYPPLSENLLAGNPEHRDLREMADEARLLLHSELINSQRVTLGLYKEAKAANLSVEGLEASLAAAADGNLKTLFLPGDASLWGTREDGKIKSGQPESLETIDLYQIAALAALDAGSEIYFLEEAQLPTDSKVIGIQRWQDQAKTSVHAAAGVV